MNEDAALSIAKAWAKLRAQIGGVEADNARLKTPEGIIETMKGWGDDLDAYKRRMLVLERFCGDCGSLDPYCQCSNDE